MIELIRSYVEMDMLAYEMMKKDVAGESNTETCRKYNIAVTMFVASARAHYGDYNKSIEDLLTQFERDEEAQAELKNFMEHMVPVGQISQDEWNTHYVR